jgi:hypothetical protein
MLLPKVQPSRALLIAEMSKSFIGQTELKNNSGFKDPDFAAKIKACGWEKGWAWCVFFCELVWKMAYGKGSETYKILDRLFAPSAMGTLANFRGSSHFKTGSLPRVGALAIYQKGFGWQGHMAIVVFVHSDGTFDTVEGNTNASPEERDGTVVTAKFGKKVGLPAKKDKLNLVGFVYPSES